MSYIGYHLAEKDKKQGTRVRTAHYLGRELRDAIMGACGIDREWDTEVAYWKAESTRQRNCTRVESTSPKYSSRGAHAYIRHRRRDAYAHGPAPRADQPAARDPSRDIDRQLQVVLCRVWN